MARWMPDGRIRLENGLVLGEEDVVTVRDMREVFSLMMAQPVARVETLANNMVRTMNGRRILPVASRVPVLGRHSAAAPSSAGGWEIAVVRHVPPGSPEDGGPVPTGVELDGLRDWAFGVSVGTSGVEAKSPVLLGVMDLRSQRGLAGMLFSPDGGSTLVPFEAGQRYSVLGRGAQMPPFALPLAVDSRSAIIYDGAGGISTEFADAGKGAYFVAARRAPERTA